MTIRNFFFFLLLFVPVSCAQTKPKVTLSTSTVIHSGRVEMHGTGFTPKRNVLSHLRRPDGTEFPVLAMLADDHGEFTHEIDTLLLSPGMHEVWVVDDATKVSSDVVRFEVVLEVPKR